jgi:hypothetical protein
MFHQNTDVKQLTILAIGGHIYWGYAPGQFDSFLPLGRKLFRGRSLGPATLVWRSWLSIRQIHVNVGNSSCVYKVPGNTLWFSTSMFTYLYKKWSIYIRFTNETCWFSIAKLNWQRIYKWTVWSIYFGWNGPYLSVFNHAVPHFLLGELFYSFFGVQAVDNCT